MDLYPPLTRKPRRRYSMDHLPVFYWYVTYSWANFLLVRSHQTEIIIVKRLIQGRDNVTRVGIESRLYDHRRRKNITFTLKPFPGIDQQLS